MKARRSLDVVLEQVRIERATQLDHFDALDSKAGSCWGSPARWLRLSTGQHLFAWLARLAAAVAGLVALWTFVPRKYASTDVLVLRQRYLGAEPAFTKLVLLDNHVSMVETNQRLIGRKARRLQVAMACLAAAVMLASMGVPLH